MNISSKKTTINKKNVWYSLLAFFAFFPFLFPNPFISSDVQPYALIIGIAFFIINIKNFVKYSLNYTVIIVIFLTFLAVIIGMASVNISSTSQVLRALANYLTIFVIPISLLLLNDRKNLDTEKLFKVFILIWFLVGIMQLFIDRSIFIDMVSGGRVSSGYRGVNSLASEPSFFGVQCFYFLYITKSFTKHRTLFYVLNLIMTVFLAQSLVGVIFVVTFFLQEFIEKNIGLKKIALGVVGIILLCVIWHLLINYLPHSRLTELTIGLIDNQFNLNDESGQNRLNSIINSLNMAFQNYLIPHGFLSRIGSAWGGFLCEIGVFAIGYMVIIPALFTNFYQTKRAKISTAIFIFMLYFSNVQFANPMFGFVIGKALIIQYEKSRKLKQSNAFSN